jgi:ribosome biogenesis GTPase A
MIPFGAPGAGKSNLMNKLIGIEGRFESSNEVTSGVTKEISYE